MKMLVLIILTFTSLSALASQSLHCQGTYNLKEAFEGDFTLPQGQKNLEIGEIFDLRVILSSFPNNKVELQAYYPNDPSRTYSMATLRSKGDVVELSMWREDFLIEVKCSLN